MKEKFFVAFLILLLINGCKPATAQLQIVPAFPNLGFEQPVDIQHAGDGSNRLFVVSQSGIIYVFENDNSVSNKKVFLDIRNKVLFGGEQGLLGIAFHPDYKNNGYFYINYTTGNPRRSVVSRFRVSNNDPDAADRNSELILLTVDQPYSNHNGGQTSFGPDGYLYISFGDGGSGGDPQNYAQNLRSLLGKILRIDVDKTSGNLNYSIPDDNPYKGNTNGLREEIYAFGLRNVWRFSFDKLTNNLWAADVGQNAWEEINIIEKGKNYGWRIMEGNHCFNPPSNCNTTNLTMPIWEYGRDSQGGYSVTGGFVYRGPSASELSGKYIYGDFVSGKIWALEMNGNNVSNQLLFSTSHSISTFGIDGRNELYFANYNTGKLYKFRGTTTKVGSNYLPGEYRLFQNFPNPFNPTTNISFSIPRESFVSLKVYDSLGNEVAILVDELMSAGYHNVQFSGEGNNLASGIYFYTLMVTGLTGLVNSFTQTKKLVLLK
jgi:hypothetical protein